MAGLPPLPDGASLDELCDFIVSRYHDAVRRDVPQIEERLRLLAADGPRAIEAMATFASLACSLELHMAKEENILFPAIRALAEAARRGRDRPALPFPTVLHPIRVMEAEHQRLDDLLSRLRWITGGFVATDDRGLRWQQACEAIAAFDRDLVEHTRIENTVLFPQALDLERTLV